MKTIRSYGTGVICMGLANLFIAFELATGIGQVSVLQQLVSGFVIILIGWAVAWFTNCKPVAWYLSYMGVGHFIVAFTLTYGAWRVSALQQLCQGAGMILIGVLVIFLTRKR